MCNKYLWLNKAVLIYSEIYIDINTQEKFFTIWIVNTRGITTFMSERLHNPIITNTPSPSHLNASHIVCPQMFVIQIPSSHSICFLNIMVVKLYTKCIHILKICMVKNFHGGMCKHIYIFQLKMHTQSTMRVLHRTKYS